MIAKDELTSWHTKLLSRSCTHSCCVPGSISSVTAYPRSTSHVLYLPFRFVLPRNKFGTKSRVRPPGWPVDSFPVRDLSDVICPIGAVDFIEGENSPLIH